MCKVGTLRVIAVLALLLSLPSCSLPDFAWAENRILEFRKDYNDREYDTIYRAASESFKKRESLSAFTDRMANAHDKLGEAESSRLLGKTYRPTLDGLVMNLEYETMYTKGKGRENFYYETVDGVTRLTEYQITSAALTLN